MTISEEPHNHSTRRICCTGSRCGY